MKKQFFYITLCFAALTMMSIPSFAQSTVQYQGTPTSKVMTRGLYGADSGLVITPSDTFNKSLPVGTIRFLTDLSGYVFTGSYWKYINAPNLAAYMRYTDTAAMLSPYARTSAIPSIAGKLNIVDTANIRLRPIAGTNMTISGTYPNLTFVASGGGSSTDTTSLSNRIDVRVKYTDTSAMLSPYARTAAIPSITGKVNYTDTAAMLSPYARTAAIPSITGKVNYTDTSAMLGNYSTRINAKQPQLSGTGFVKATGTTISYDNSAYLTTATAASTYAQISTTVTLTGSQTITNKTLTSPSIATPLITGLSSGTTNDSILVSDPSTGAVRRISSARISSGGGGGTDANAYHYTGDAFVGSMRLGASGTGTRRLSMYLNSDTLLRIGVTSAGFRWAVINSNNGVANNYDATVVGGEGGNASGIRSIVLGAAYGQAQGTNSISMGGGIAESSNSWAWGSNSTYANGANSIAWGGYANNSNYTGCFNWSDFSETSFSSNTANNQYMVKAAGGVVFKTAAATTRMTIKSTGIVNISNTPTYADNTAALAGGLVAGDVYRTSTGVLMIAY